MRIEDLAGPHQASVAVGALAATSVAGSPQYGLTFLQPVLITGYHVIAGSAVTGRTVSHATLELIHAGTGGSGTSSVASLNLSSGAALTLGRQAIDAALSYEVPANSTVQVKYTTVDSGMALPPITHLLTYSYSSTVSAS